MRIAILTNEYPPHVYGGAGVHVEYLTRELARIEQGRHRVSVICFGDQDIREGNLTVRGINPSFRTALPGPPAQEVPRDDAPRPGHGGDARGRGHRPLPHLVHPPGRLPRQAAYRGEARPDDPFAGTPPALEGRAARLCLSSELLDRADRLRECRWRDRRLRGDARGRSFAVRSSLRQDPDHP